MLQRKILQVRSRNGGGGEEGRVSGHKLKITDGLTDRIILVVTSLAILLVSLSRHRMICLYKSHYNIVRNVVNIYRYNFLSGYLRTVNLILSVTVYKNLHVIALFVFLSFLFPL